MCWKQRRETKRWIEKNPIRNNSIVTKWLALRCCRDRCDLWGNRKSFKLHSIASSAFNSRPSIIISANKRSCFDAMLLSASFFSSRWWLIQRKFLHVLFHRAINYLSGESSMMMMMIRQTASDNREEPFNFKKSRLFLRFHWEIRASFSFSLFSLLLLIASFKPEARLLGSVCLLSNVFLLLLLCFQRFLSPCPAFFIYIFFCYNEWNIL